ncbi:hypothetical protein K1719_037513 [Acacia pycnantha]|nr:hypothetical protein K1719_037513 [Acacia pycnantha]
MGRRIIIGLTLLFLLSEIGELVLCETCIESEKQALLKFKASIHDDPDNGLSSWNPKTDCCEWEGIACHNVTGHVIKLDLNWYGLEAFDVTIFVGVATFELFGFECKQLQCYLDSSLSWIYGEFLDLSENDLYTNDVNWVSKLQSLQNLDLSEIYLGEAYNLIQVLHMLPSLLQLQLQVCAFGNLSTPLSPTNFSNNSRVQLLDLSFNEIDGRILNAFRNWTSLKFLYLIENNLSSMPEWFGEFKNLVSLDLSYNTLCGPIPIVLRNLTSLEDLNLSSNNFSSVPSWLGELRSLRSLFVIENQIIAKMEISVSQILNNMCHLQELIIDHSNLQGEAFGDSDFSRCIKYDIEAVMLSNNKLNGHLPTWVGNFENLTWLDLSSNYFSGNIPQSLGQLVNLTHYDLSRNSLSGIIPQSIGQLVNLIYLDLSRNSLSGLIPQSIGQLVNLRSLDISSNSLCGDLPQSLGQLTQLTSLDLSNNSLNGNIPQSLEQLVNLTGLDLSSNSLSGNIPQSLGQLISLTTLDLSNNSFSGTIPHRLCHLVNLRSLALSHNNFSGEIPNCWRDSPPFPLRVALEEINFSFNKLSGAFPISICELSYLGWLHLNHNYLEGKLPLTLKCKQLRILDLGENKFFGSIPSSWTNSTLPTLQILRLRDNMLDGNIPLNLCQLKSLQILDLANNNLSGSIPHCIGNLTGMTKDSAHLWKFQNQSTDDANKTKFLEMEWSNEDVKQVMKGREYDITRILLFVVNLDLSNNNLVGSIPLELFSLIGLIGLNLSHNHFKGEIPEIIGDMKSLESFDIACNQILGKIPKSMSKLTTLNHLNMSSNNLSGPIPTENQFLTLNDPSIYVGNRYLCGIPLPNKCQDDDVHQDPETYELEDENDSEKVWFYFVIAIGFAVGFWGVIGTLVLKKSWRYACFRRVEDVADEIYVFTIIKVAKLKRLLTNHVHG